MNNDGVEFNISEHNAETNIKEFLYSQGVSNAFEYSKEYITKELLSLFLQIQDLSKKENPNLTEQQVVIRTQARMERIFGIVYEKLYEYFLCNAFE